jgi:hypothetical protein
MALCKLGFIMGNYGRKSKLAYSGFLPYRISTRSVKLFMGYMDMLFYFPYCESVWLKTRIAQQRLMEVSHA